MLSVQENEALTRVGKGTPMGELMRRYWHPIAATAELEERPTKEVRLLGEDLVLFKDLQGRYGLIDRYCAHRRVDLSYGIPEEQGLRCMYHGWMYDTKGQCIEQPFEETVHPAVSRPDSRSGSTEGVVKRFKEKVKLAGYPVEEMGGLLFAYLGPLPAPLVPRWEPFRWDNAVRDVAITHLACNWLQCQENSLDPVHVEWLHSYYSNYAKNPDLPVEQRLRLPPHDKIGFDVFEHGIIKRRVFRGYTEDDDDWKHGHPILFPNILLVGSEIQATLQFRVPIDDTNTLHISLYSYRAAPDATDVPRQARVPYRYVPLTGPDGRYIVDMTFNQDYMAWITQGPVAKRDLEKLGESDRGIILFRRMLREAIDVVEDGGDPMNIIRDPDKNARLHAPLERIKFGNRRTPRYFPAEAGWSADAAVIDQVLSTWASHREAALAPVQ